MKAALRASSLPSHIPISRPRNKKEKSSDFSLHLSLSLPSIYIQAHILYTNRNYTLLKRDREDA